MVQFPFELYDKLNQMRMAKAQEPLQQLQQAGQIGAILQQRKAQQQQFEMQKKQVKANAFQKLITSGYEPYEGDKPLNASKVLNLMSGEEMPEVQFKKNAKAEKAGEGQAVRWNGEKNAFEYVTVEGEPVKKSQIASPLTSGTAPTMAEARMKGIEQRSEFKDRDQLIQVEKAISPIGATRLGAIGQAGMNNIRAFRLIKTMEDPSATAQEQQLAVADLAAIYKGGVPDEMLMQDAGYKTLKGKYANAMTLITSQPQAINTPEVRARILKIARELIDVDNTMISRNIGTKAQSFMPLLNRLQKGEVKNMTIDQQKDWWNNLTKGVMGITEEPQSEPIAPAKPGGKVMVDAQGNRAMVYPDGTFEEIK